jgi:hypothetical protein
MLPITLLSFLIWLFLLLCWGNFWRADQRLEHGAIEDSTLETWPSVTVVIPARNEAEVLPVSLRSHLTQTYPGNHHILLVDDQSTDRTGEMAKQIAGDLGQPHRLTVMPGQPLPPGWTGKLWAMEQGYRWLQEAEKPDYVLFTDADIAHGSDILKAVVSKAEQEHLDLTSLMVLLRRETAWETLLIPAFVFFFQMLYPFPWVNDLKRRTAGAAGGFMLLRFSALERIGGLTCIRDALIDDCSLGAAVKAGGPIWLGLADAPLQKGTGKLNGQRLSSRLTGSGEIPPNTALSLRAYPHLQTIWNMVARTAYTQLHYSLWLLFGTVLSMSLIYLMGPVGLVIGLASGNAPLAWVGGCCWILMALAYWPTLRLYHCPPILAFTLPFIALLYTLMTIDSALRHWRGQGGAWKGRVYSPH